MTDPSATPLDLAAIEARANAATRGPWWWDESDQCMRLHGVHDTIPPQADGLIPEQVLNHQILKAPKTGTPYAEYWPNPADAAFIAAARTDVPQLVAEVAKLDGAMHSVWLHGRWRWLTRNMTTPEREAAADAVARATLAEPGEAPLDEAVLRWWRQ